MEVVPKAVEEMKVVEVVAEVAPKVLEGCAEGGVPKVLGGCAWSSC